MTLRKFDHPVVQSLVEVLDFLLDERDEPRGQYFAVQSGFAGGTNCGTDGRKNDVRLENVHVEQTASRFVVGE